MLKPIVDSAIENVPSRYALVIGISKRARQIVDEAQREGEILVEKPVGLAVDEFLNKEFTIVEPPKSDDEEDENQPRVAAQNFSLDDVSSEDSTEEE